jgi:hypothetical protein
LLAGERAERTLDWCSVVHPRPLPEPALDRDDVLAILGALADIRSDTRAIRDLLEVDDEEERWDEP